MPMTDGTDHDNRLVTGSVFLSRAQERLTFDVPAALTNPDAIARSDPHNADPALLAAIAAVRPIRPAAVLVPVVQRNEPGVLFTGRTARLNDHWGGDFVSRRQDRCRRRQPDGRRPTRVRGRNRACTEIC